MNCETKTLNHHKKIKHPEGLQAGYACDECDVVCKEEKTLDRHKKNIHKDLLEVKCDQCKFSSKREDTVAFHKKMVHGKNSGKVHQSDICDFNTIYKNSLNRHKKRLHGYVDTAERKIF
jgi:hypothetical protein